MYDYSKLRSLIKGKFKTEKKFAELLGINSTTLSHIFNGRGYFPHKKVDEICGMLEINLLEIGLYFFTKKTVKFTI